MIMGRQVMNKFWSLATTVARVTSWVDVFLDPAEARKLLEKRDEILGLLPKRYVKPVTCFLEWLEKNINKIGGFLYDPEVAEQVKRYARYVLAGEKSAWDSEEAWRVLVRYMPLPAYKEEGGKRKDVVVINPPRTTMKKLRPHTIDMEAIFDRLLERVIRLDNSTNTVMVYDMKITLPRARFLWAMYRYAVEEYTRYVIQRVNNALKTRQHVVEKVFALGRTVYISLKPQALIEYAREKGLHIPEGFPSSIEDKIFIEVSGGPEPGLSFEIKLVSRGAEYTYSIPALCGPDDLEECLGEFLDTALERCVRWLNLAEQAERIAQQYGYTYSSTAILKPHITLQRRIDLSDNAYVAAHVIIDENRVAVTCEASWRKRGVKLDKTLFEEKLSSSGIDYDECMFTEKSVEVSRGFSLDEVEAAAKYGVAVSNILREALEEHISQAKKARSRVFSDAHYLALYLAKYLTGLDINVTKHTGRSENYMNLAVIRTIVKYAGKEALEKIKQKARFWGTRTLEEYGYIVRVLADAGAIDVDEHGEILVLGRPLKQLLRDLGIGGIEEICRRVLRELVFWVQAGGRRIEDILKTKGILTPECVRALIRAGVHLSAKVLAEPWKDGKIVADGLDDTTKLLYLDTAYERDLEYILVNPDLRRAFSGLSFTIIARSHRWGPSMLLRAILAYAPDVVGVNPKEVQVYHHEGKVAGIDMGAFVVTPYRVYATSPFTRKWFLVFSKHDKNGVVVPAKTVVDAVLVVSSNWEKVVAEAQYVADRIRSLDPDAECVRAEYAGFQYALIRLPESWYYKLAEIAPDDIQQLVEREGKYIVIPVYPGISTLIDQLEEARAEKTGEDYEELTQ